MAAHRTYLRASVCVLVALLGCPAAALAEPQRVPDEAALTEYVAVLPGAEGPLLPGPGAAPPTQALPARIDGALVKLPPGRASTLRRVATDPSLGAPLTAGAARPAPSAAVTAGQPSALSAVGDAVGTAPASAILLAVLLVLAVLGAATGRRRRGPPASS